MKRISKKNQVLINKEKIISNSPYDDLRSSSKGYVLKNKERRTKGYAHDFSNVHGWN
nr:MAG TPA: hypothetical protein [Caudoviricetes sp.]